MTYKLLFSFAMLSMLSIVTFIPDHASAMFLEDYVVEFGACDESDNGVIDEDEAQCVEDLWVLASEQCIATSDPEDCWMTGGHPYPIDPQTGAHTIADDFYGIDLPEGGYDPGTIQGMTVFEYGEAIAQCNSNYGTQPILWSVCVTSVNALAIYDCWSTGSAVDCWMH